MDLLQTQTISSSNLIKLFFKTSFRVTPNRVWFVLRLSMSSSVSRSEERNFIRLRLPVKAKIVEQWMMPAISFCQQRFSSSVSSISATAEKENRFEFSYKVFLFLSAHPVKLSICSQPVDLNGGALPTELD